MFQFKNKSGGLNVITRLRRNQKSVHSLDRETFYTMRRLITIQYSPKQQLTF